MFTDEQMEKYYEGIEYFTRTIPNVEFQPPRTFNVNDYPNLPGRNDPGFGDGQILVLGFKDPNDELYNCECDKDHVKYGPVRADGLIAPMQTSGTIGEALATGNELPDGLDDSMAGMLRGLLGSQEKLAPTYEEMREVQPDEWPSETISRESGTLTDMTDFEF